MVLFLTPVLVLNLAWLAGATTQVGRWASRLEDKILGKPKIVGGYEVKENYSMPWLVSLRDDSLFHFCGGTLIAPRVVMTAAHCVSPKPDLPWWDNRFPFVAVGNHHQEKDYQERELFYQPVITITHSGFNTENVTDDIALLFFDEDLVDKNGDLGLVTLPDPTHEIENGKKGVSYGWGLLDQDMSEPSAQLYGVDTFMYSRDMCELSSLYEPGSLVDGMFCAGGELGGDGIMGGLDTCSGDSGGPYLDYESSDDESSPLQLGIVSWGVGCGRDGYPGVYVELAAYSEWIIRTMDYVERLKPTLSCFSSTGLTPEIVSKGVVDTVKVVYSVDDVEIGDEGVGLPETATARGPARAAGVTGSGLHRGILYASDACEEVPGTINSE